MTAATTTKPRSKAAKTAPIAATAEADFLRGRDLAVAMLAEADEIEHAGNAQTYHRRAYRGGTAQNRFTEKYIEQLIEDPAMLNGFNAVLSAKLGDQCISKAGHYSAPMAEYQAGAIGADGTAPLDDGPEPEHSPQAEPQAQHQDKQSTASEFDLPAVLTLQQVDQWSQDFNSVEAALTMLHFLYSDVFPDGKKSRMRSDDIMGVLQHADHLLSQLNTQIMDVDGVLPDDLRWRTYEASSLVSLLEAIGREEDFSLDNFGVEFLEDYINAARVAAARGHAALKAHWEAHGA